MRVSDRSHGNGARFGVTGRPVVERPQGGRTDRRGTLAAFGPGKAFGHRRIEPVDRLQRPHAAQLLELGICAFGECAGRRRERLLGG
ncbi:MAG: hypothetical protein ACO3NL_13970, partial [Phycisphaerales bacterium]